MSDISNINSSNNNQSFYQSNQILNSNLMLPGAVVRTKRVWDKGVYKGLVRGVFVRDGVKWVKGIGWEFPENQLEIIRPVINL